MRVAARQPALSDPVVSIVGELGGGPGLEEADEGGFTLGVLALVKERIAAIIERLGSRRQCGR